MKNTKSQATIKTRVKPFTLTLVILSLFTCSVLQAFEPSKMVNEELFSDPDYQAIINEATALGYGLPSADDQNIQSQVVASLKSSGVWQKADVIYYFKGSGSKEFKLINWKNPTGPKAVESGGSLTWSNTGATGDGIALINTNFNLSVGSHNYAQNDAGIYINVTQAHTTKFGMVGNDHNSADYNDVDMRNKLQRQYINSDGSQAPLFSFAGIGLFGASRNSTTTQILSIGTVTTTVNLNSGIEGTQNFTLFGWGGNTSDANRFDGEISYALFGADMSANLSDIETAFAISTPNQSDIQAPTAPTLSSTGHSETTADLSWSGATDDVGVTQYRVYKDASLEATLGNVGSYQVTGLTASTTYSFTVTALDAAGNESVASNAVSVTTDSGSGGGGGSSVWSEAGSVASYTGDVAIGTSTVPTGYKLAVEGKIRTREVRVDQDTWPDYVFSQGYDLPSLEEIQKHINEKGHLPNIPSAQEVEKNGIELGEMDRLLLEKIEELTLYIIRLDEISKEQKRINDDFKKEMELLKKLANEKL